MLLFWGEGHLDHGLRQPFTINLAFNPDSTEEMAVESVTSTVAKLAAYTDSLVVINELSIDQNATGQPWWKAVVFGSVVGVLLAMGWAYVWEDARGHRNRRQTGGEDA